MINFDNIKTYSEEFPNVWSFLGDPEKTASISQNDKDQIFFLNNEASEFVKNYINNSNMITGPIWSPFNERYFKTIQEFPVTENCEKELKKWLYSKSIPFDKFVYMDRDRSGQAIALTWKMVIKYCEGLFFADDLILFDETLNWGLYYFHEDRLYYGTDKIYDKDFEYEKTLELNELKKKFFKKNNQDNIEGKKRIIDFKEKHNVNRFK
ncbi:hypothetical protein KFE94_16445 [bacterium SCSIO 12643]|nr:hypothetical protein KFE94_16445 [bacterium SCSIO 12643]